MGYFTIFLSNGLMKEILVELWKSIPLSMETTVLVTLICLQIYGVVIGYSAPVSTLMHINSKKIEKYHFIGQPFDELLYILGDTIHFVWILLTKIKYMFS